MKKVIFYFKDSTTKKQSDKMIKQVENSDLYKKAIDVNWSDFCKE